MFGNLFKYKEKTSTKEEAEALKDELWNDNDVILFIAKHNALSLNKDDYSLNDLKRIKIASEIDNQNKINRHKYELNKIFDTYKQMEDL